MRDQIHYWANRLPKCPHCDTDLQVWDFDNPLALNYEDGGKTDFDCPSCKKGFVCVTIVKYEFSTAVSEEAADDEEWGPLDEAHC